MNLLRSAGRRVSDFAAGDPGATYLCPRWLILRAVGLVYVLIFLGIVAAAPALIGSGGIAPVAEFCALVERVFPNGFERVLRAPSWLLISCSDRAITVVAWAGLAASLALLINLWPRVALFGCWSALLSFVATWQQFSPAIIDSLMLEVALLSIPFAPRGLRPGLGAASPPARLSVLMMRWLLVRTMFGAGLIKVFAGDPRWWELTAMEAMYETSPTPTWLGYYAFHLPHAYHVGEIAFALLTELGGPILAVFGGRRGRVVVFIAWTVFQIGIQLTGNFGWLNTAAIALGLVLLDDQIVRAAWGRLRRARTGFGGRALEPPPRPIPARRWTRVPLAVALWGHFGLTLYFSVVASLGWLVPGIPDPKRKPIEYLFRDFQSANAYVPYASFPETRYEVEFFGSNDGGQTWRPYLFKTKPQTEDRVGAFVAPRFARFEATLQAGLYSNSPLILRVAQKLVEGNEGVEALFRADPFPEGPPEIVRMPVFSFAFTDPATQRATGHFWRKTYVADFAEPVVRPQP